VRLLGVKLRNEGQLGPDIPAQYIVFPMCLDERDIRTPDDVRDEAEGLPGRWWFDVWQKADDSWYCGECGRLLPEWEDE